MENDDQQTNSDDYIILACPGQLQTNGIMMIGGIKVTGCLKLSLNARFSLPFVTTECMSQLNDDDVGGFL